MYKLGLVVGRFQPVHKGHIAIIEEAIKCSEKVLILVGSAQESNTEKNPYNYELRKTLLEACFDKDLIETKLFIRPLLDAGLGNVGKWGDYVMDNAHNIMGEYPDAFFSGIEERRISWFENFEINEVLVEKIGGFNATDIRDALINGDLKKLVESAPNCINNRFNELSEIMKIAVFNKKTDSI